MLPWSSAWNPGCCLSNFWRMNNPDIWSGSNNWNKNNDWLGNWWIQNICVFGDKCGKLAIGSTWVDHL